MGRSIHWTDPDSYRNADCHSLANSNLYADGVTIAHTHAEFVLDFITNCYPRPVVSARVYLAAPQVPVLLNLIDQIHGLRAELKTMLDALEELPEDVRATVRTRITKRKPKSR